jgi:hypothetical protein
MYTVYKKGFPVAHALTTHNTTVVTRDDYDVAIATAL